MNVADCLWRLVASGVLVGAQIERARDVLEVSESELKAARARWENPTVPPARTELHGPVVDQSIHARYVPTAMTLRTRATARWTDAGRARAAEKAFVSLRVERPRCDACGQFIESGDVVIVSRAHHSSCAHKGRVA